LKSLLQDFVEIQHEVVQDFVESMRWCRFLLKARHVRHQTCSKKLLDSSSKAAEQQLAKLMGSTSPSCLPLHVPLSKLAKVGLQLAKLLDSSSQKLDRNSCT
jgi:hypothetical protein